MVQAAASAATLAPAVAAPALELRLHVGAVGVGLYISLVYLTAMVSSQWGTVFVRRWGPIRTGQVALGFSAAGLLLMVVPHVAAAAAGAVLIGFGYGPITPASSAILARTTPAHRFALVFSIKQTGVPLGGAFALWPEQAAHVWHRVAAPFPVSIRQGQAHIRAKAGTAYQVLIDGRRIVDVQSHGEDTVPLE